MRRVPVILFALIFGISVSGCGQKGPLKLPPEAPKSAATGSAQ